MLDKAQKTKILENIKDKDEKMVISNVLDKAIRFEKNEIISVTNFLNLNEFAEIKRVLELFKVKYNVLYINDYIEKKNIAFIPKYLEKNIDKIYSENISCIKIISNVKGKLLHKDYMGAIYSMGIKREFIGDIIAKEDVAYFFCMKSVEEYFNLNLTSVGKQEIKTEILDIFSDEVKNLSLNFTKREVIIPSYRIDALLSEVYNLSRNETKDKIVAGDLYINDKNIFYPNTVVKSGDIISFRKCGKMKVGSEIRKTKSSNIVLTVYKYS